MSGLFFQSSRFSIESFSGSPNFWRHSEEDSSRQNNALRRCDVAPKNVSLPWTWKEHSLKANFHEMIFHKEKQLNVTWIKRWLGWNLVMKWSDLNVLFDETRITDKHDKQTGNQRARGSCTRKVVPWKKVIVVKLSTLYIGLITLATATVKVTGKVKLKQWIEVLFIHSMHMLSVTARGTAVKKCHKIHSHALPLDKILQRACKVSVSEWRTHHKNLLWQLPRDNLSWGFLRLQSYSHSNISENQTIRCVKDIFQW